MVCSIFYCCQFFRYVQKFADGVNNTYVLTGAEMEKTKHKEILDVDDNEFVSLKYAVDN